ncbi:hypothetical protein [Chondromyces apiculatus]|uniref:Uncharacterized protein n=1 Tax=Chondromyces apiculatus DSM 436 TaxID=1192034 RepID=A0A017T634_9BACT|nr:hypothetical protein [Chondromyces apiculatus]EYF04669.1 Hypothetical protein CAP_4345 [Chondromyces apiculatus DSM 436]
MPASQRSATHDRPEQPAVLRPPPAWSPRSHDLRAEPPPARHVSRHTSPTAPAASMRAHPQRALRAHRFPSIPGIL